jgi:shikimate dehydrogenase
MSPSASAGRYVVMGNPIEHSKSPQIHRLFAAQTGSAIDYEKMLVPLGRLDDALKKFAAGDGCGANITVPFKHEACRLVDTISARAKRAEAVNTVRVDEDGLFGDNTDGVGLLRDLRDNLECTLRGQNILLIGAGGAASGVVEPLLAAEPESFTIANRTLGKAKSLARRFVGSGNVRATGFDDLGAHDYQLVINATSAGLSSERPLVPATLIGADTVCYDMMYAAQPTAFMAWAAGLNARIVVDGLGMLVEQAAESFYLWRGTRPETKAVIEQLRK